jgi:hypothetical protein
MGVSAWQITTAEASIEYSPECFTPAEQLYSLAASSMAHWGCLYHSSNFATDRAYIRSKIAINAPKPVSLLRIAH